MNIKNCLVCVTSLFLVTACLTGCSTDPSVPTSTEPKVLKEPVQTKFDDGYERAYFASGCFWCVEAVYESVEGVKESISGYSGGHTENPTYELSNTGRTGHAEAVEIIYDPTW